MLFHHAKVSLKVSSILFKLLTAYFVMEIVAVNVALCQSLYSELWWNFSILFLIYFCINSSQNFVYITISSFTSVSPCIRSFLILHCLITLWALSMWARYFLVIIRSFFIQISHSAVTEWVALVMMMIMMVAVARYFDGSWLQEQKSYAIFPIWPQAVCQDELLIHLRLE